LPITYPYKNTTLETLSHLYFYLLLFQAAEAEERRTVLASLKGHGKQQKVGSIRVGPAVKKADGPGILPVASGSSKKTNTKEFAIYQVRIWFWFSSGKISLCV